MLLLVGLGNPGPKYAANRHNIGFMAVDEIVRRHHFGPWRKRFQAEVAEGVLAGEKVLAMKPQTYMNESGRAVGEAMRFFQLAAGDVVALHDELDLPPAKLRVKTGGGHAGHNGLRSIAAHIGADFHRVRLGIGHPGDKALVHRYVLDDFAKAEMPPVEALVEAVSRHADRLGARDFATFQNRVHLELNPPPPKEPAKGAASAKAGEGKD